MKTVWLTGGKGERGAALVAALLMLVLVTTLGMAAILTSSTETMIAENHYKAYEALYAADAGIQDAMARLDNDDIVPDEGNFATWSSVIPTTSVGGMSYRTVVKFRLEDGEHYDTEDNNELVLYNAGFKGTTDGLFGYDHSPITTAGSGKPVLVITSVGTVNSAIRPASATIVSEVTENTINIYSPGGMFSGICMDISGASGAIDGGADKPGVVTNAVGCPADSVISGTNGDTPEGGAGIDMETYLGFPVSEISQYATETYTYDSTVNEGDLNFGALPDSPAIVYIDNAGYELRANNMTGYGVLVVTGSLDVGGGFDWDGLVYVMEDLKLHGGGGNAVNITGGCMAKGITEVKAAGSVNITYDGPTLDGIATKGFRYKILNWKQVFN